MVGRSSTNTNQTSWPLIRRMKRRSRKRKKRRVEKGKQDKRASTSKISVRKHFMLLMTISFFVVGYCLTFVPFYSDRASIPQPVALLFLLYREFKVQNNLRSVERSELESKCIFSCYERYLVSFILFRHLLNTHA